MKRRKLFCEYGPVAYKIAVIKEAIRKDIQDILLNQKIAKNKKNQNLKYIYFKRNYLESYKTSHNLGENICKY